MLWQMRSAQFSLTLLDALSHRALSISLVIKNAVALVSLCNEFGCAAVGSVAQSSDSLGLKKLRRSPIVISAVGRYPASSGTQCVKRSKLCEIQPSPSKAVFFQCLLGVPLKHVSPSLCTARLPMKRCLGHCASHAAFTAWYACSRSAVE